MALSQAWVYTFGCLARMNTDDLSEACESASHHAARFINPTETAPHDAARSISHTAKTSHFCVSKGFDFSKDDRRIGTVFCMGAGQDQA